VVLELLLVQLKRGEQIIKGAELSLSVSDLMINEDLQYMKEE